MSNIVNDDYKVFTERFRLLASKHPKLITNTLSNIFSMRLIGNKTHGDLAEIGIAEFIHQFMYDFDGEHVGKDLYRSKEHEEDIVVINELNKRRIPISLKAYGDGPLQLSTDKEALMFPTLQKYGKLIDDKDTIRRIFNSEEFESLKTINVMPLIYREKDKQCNIMIFDFAKMEEQTRKIMFIDKGYRYNFDNQEFTKDKGRLHPIYMFLDKTGHYICEVRYGLADANALQRGFWTHTVHALQYFNSLTNGWLSYEANATLVRLFRLALNSSKEGHANANLLLQNDIDRLRGIL